MKYTAVAKKRRKKSALPDAAGAEARRFVLKEFGAIRPAPVHGRELFSCHCQMGAGTHVACS